MRRTFLLLSTRLDALWELAKHEHATPREIGRAVGLGVFVGCSPAIGFHAGIALGLATLLRLNRLWTFLGSRMCTLAILPWIVLTEVELAHRVRTGAWAPLRVDAAVHDARGLLLDWVTGFVVVGCVLGLAFGALAYALARAYRASSPSRAT